MWSNLRKRICRKLRTTSLRYIQTWERHQRGGLHCNVTIEGEGIRELLQYQTLKPMMDYDDMPFNTVLSPMAVECGWGPSLYMQAVGSGDGDAMAGYLVKLATELTGAGEKCQIPIDAPPHFRRLRASPGLLPPLNRSGKFGWLVFRPLTSQI